MDSERLAIIDLGTNTFHLLIVEVRESEDFIITNRYREPVRLGEGGMTSGKISSAPFERGIRVLKSFRKLINSKGAGKVLAYATSAIRSSSNGAEFIRRARQEADIDIRIINGNEEAALIFGGVASGVNLPYDKDTLIVDIGGGSVEFIVCREGKPLLLRSIDVGAARLLGQMKAGNPISTDEIVSVKKNIHELIGGLLKELKQFSLPLLVGSSGSFETVAAIIANEENDVLSTENLNSYKFSKTAFTRVYKKIIKSTREERLKIPGMEPMRVDMIVMSVILMDVIVQEVGIEDIMISMNALKEGILYHHLDEKRERLNHLMGGAKNLRHKSVRSLARKFRCDADHGLKVSELGLSLFDHLSPMHQLGQQERDLLKFCCLLHDIGYFIAPSGHHKHGQYIVMNSAMNGFSHDELIIMGNIVRYHRKSQPTRDHFHFNILSQHHRFVVRVLAAILRVADQLDRGHRHLVEELIVKTDNNKIEIFVDARENVDMEIQNAMENRAMLEGVFSLEVMIKSEG
jgi:exopolyphosphatase / guanosine-5'-triphosphate,3'-diphosphate pyrophosphatase